MSSGKALRDFIRSYDSFMPKFTRGMLLFKNFSKILISVS
jgi:hypothetical protein